jgi:hypothetical protein
MKIFALINRFSNRANRKTIRIETISLIYLLHNEQIFENKLKFFTFLILFK